MNIVLKVGYIGTEYGGFQKQKDNPRTIQGCLEWALRTAFKEDIKVIGAGRTDKGVHSKAQMVQFKAFKNLEPIKYPHILNNILPLDIRVYNGYEVANDFHVQYSAVGKRYTYRIDCNKVPIIKEIPFTLHIPFKLNLKKMEEAALTLLGTHDFTAYASRFSNVENRIRTIDEISLTKDENNILSLTIMGNGFLHNMVRIIAGTLIDVGRGTYDTGVFLRAFESKTRSDLGRTAKAKGLILEEILYEEDFL